MPEEEALAEGSQPLHNLKPGIRLVPESITTSESGRRATLHVRLTSVPRALVRVSLSSSDTSEAEVEPTQLEFTAFTWWIPRRVTVRGIADLLLDGDVRFEVLADASSADRRYDQLEPVRAVGTNRDAAAFHGLGDLPGGDILSVVEALSAAGDVAVGYSTGSAGSQAFRWTPEAGLEGLQGDSGRARAVSPDGKLIVGSLHDVRWEFQRRAAVMWRAPDAAPEYFHEPIVPPTNQIMWFVDATAVTDTGEAFGTCLQYRAYGEPIACRTPIPANIFLQAAYVFGITPQGESYVGTRLPPRYPTRIFGSVAIFNGVELGYPTDTICLIPHDCKSEARDLSADASLVIGTAIVPPPGGDDSTGPLAPTAFTYTQSEGMLRLPDLEGGATVSGANAISDDGAIIAGYGTSAAGQQATLWIEREPVSLRELLTAAGASVPGGWQLTEVRALSSDGRTLAGAGVNPAGEQEAFRALLPDL